MEVPDLFFGLLLFISGVVLGAFLSILKDLILTPYENWKGKRYIRIENHESLKSLIEGFCSDWELLKCYTLPFVNIGGDLIETSREIYGLIAKNEKDFESDVSDSIREICRKFIVASSQLPDSDDAAWSNHIEGDVDDICEDFKKALNRL